MVKEKNIAATRIVQAYLSSVISISLVLLLIGIVALFGVNAGTVTDYFKENIRVTAMMDETADETTANEVMSAILEKQYTSRVDYISREKGAEEMRQMLGDDFLDVFETNPIPISLEIYLDADYFHSDSIRVIQTEIEAMDHVDELVYQSSLIDIVNSNMEKIGFVFALLICMLLFISFVLINNTVRLNIYSKRFSVHTMRLVGATKAFIRRPFLIKAALQGLVAGILAVIYMIGILYLMKNEFSQMFEIFDTMNVVYVLGGIILCGVLLCVVSTYFVVNKMIVMNKDKMYF